MPSNNYFTPSEAIEYNNLKTQLFGQCAAAVVDDTPEWKRYNELSAKVQEYRKQLVIDKLSDNARGWRDTWLSIIRAPYGENKFLVDHGAPNQERYEAAIELYNAGLATRYKTSFPNYYCYQIF